MGWTQSWALLSVEEIISYSFYKMFPRNLPTGFDKQSLRWIESLGTRRFYIFLSLYQWQVHWPPHSSWPGRCEAGTCASNWEWPERERQCYRDDNIAHSLSAAEEDHVMSHSFFALGPMSGCCLCLFFSVTCKCRSVRSLVTPPVSNSASVGSVVTCYGPGYWCQKSRLMRRLSCLTGRRGMWGMSHDVGDL